VGDLELCNAVPLFLFKNLNVKIPPTSNTVTETTIAMIPTAGIEPFSDESSSVIFGGVDVVVLLAEKVG
jgi:hypothetical protein